MSRIRVGGVWEGGAGTTKCAKMRTRRTRRWRKKGEEVKEEK